VVGGGGGRPPSPAMQPRFHKSYANRCHEKCLARTFFLDQLALHGI